MHQITKFISLGIILFSIAACNNQSKNNFSISGEFVLPNSNIVKLIHLGIKEATTIDSVLANNENKFTIKAPLVHPALFALRIKGYSDIFLVIHPDDKISIEIDNSISPIAYSVKASTDSRLVNEIMTAQERVRGKITRLSIDYENSKNNPETFEEQKIKFDSIYDNLLLSHKQFTSKFIRNNPKSLACIFALYQNFGKQKSQALFDTFEDIEIFNLVDSCLTTLYPNTEAVIALNRDVTEIKEQIKHKNYSERMICPGRKSPDFELITLDSTSISLNDYKDEPVVFFFFAVWNKESIKEAIELNNLINKYSYRNLKIVGISLDLSPDKLEGFISEKNIKFPIACDYAYWNSKYVQQFGVRSVPDILLLDRNHIIYKRNIQSQELIQILSEWKKSKLSLQKYL